MPQKRYMEAHSMEGLLAVGVPRRALGAAASVGPEPRVQDVVHVDYFGPVREPFQGLRRHGRQLEAARRWGLS